MAAKNFLPIPLLTKLIIRDFKVSPKIAKQIAKQVDTAFNRYMREKSQQMQAHSYLRESRLLEDFANKLDKTLTEAFNSWKRDRKAHLREELDFGWLPMSDMKDTNRIIADAESHMEGWISPIQEAIEKSRISADGYRKKANESDPGIDRNRRGGKRSMKPLANLWKELQEISGPLGRAHNQNAYHFLRFLSPDLASFPELKNKFKILADEFGQDSSKADFDPESQRKDVIEYLRKMVRNYN